MMLSYVFFIYFNILLKVHVKNRLIRQMFVYTDYSLVERSEKLMSFRQIFVTLLT